MNKGILKSKRMIGMIITLAAGAVIMLGLAVYMFIFAAQSQEIYFGDTGSFEERLDKNEVTGIVIFRYKNDYNKEHFTEFADTLYNYLIAKKEQ